MGNQKVKRRRTDNTMAMRKRKKKTYNGRLSTT